MLLGTKPLVYKIACLSTISFKFSKKHIWMIYFLARKDQLSPVVNSPSIYFPWTLAGQFSFQFCAISLLIYLFILYCGSSHLMSNLWWGWKEVVDYVEARPFPLLLVLLEASRGVLGYNLYVIMQCLFDWYYQIKLKSNLICC